MKIVEGIKIISLEDKYLEESFKVVQANFEDEGKNIRRELEASIDEKKFQNYVKTYDKNMVSIEYFIAIDEGEQVLGTVGLYSIKKDFEDTYWVGWYCVKEEHRGRGIGIALLEFVIEEARRRNKKYLKLFTSTYKSEAKAQGIYEKYGFYITKVKKKKHHYILYRMKVL